MLNETTTRATVLAYQAAASVCPDQRTMILALLGAAAAAATRLQLEAMPETECLVSEMIAATADVLLDAEERGEQPVMLGSA